MEVLRTIQLYTEDKAMPFLVIGGHAVNAYGISRQTGDLDFVVPLTSKEKWEALLAKLHYKVGQNDQTFARFSPDTITSWPIDLMFVDDSTFEKMYQDSAIHIFGPASARVISARHLIALKIHALKVFQEHRYAKDFTDIICLLKSGSAVLSDEELQAMCVRYANIELYHKLKNEGR
jgi:hypothetical protein